MDQKKQNDDPVKLFTMKVKSSKLDRYKLMAEERGVSLSKLIQTLLDGQPMPERKSRKKDRRSVPKVDPDLLFQVAAIGNNLNQIARRINSGEKLEVLIYLSEIEKRLGELVDAHQVP